MKKIIIVDANYVRSDFLINIVNEIKYEQINLISEKAVKYNNDKDYNYIFVIEDNDINKKINNIKKNLLDFKERYKFDKIEDAISFVDANEEEIDKINRM